MSDFDKAVMAKLEEYRVALELAKLEQRGDKVLVAQAQIGAFREGLEMCLPPAYVGRIFAHFEAEWKRKEEGHD